VIAQVIVRVVSSSLREEVGPWSQRGFVTSGSDRSGKDGRDVGPVAKRNKN
jgi:hypothetical protein